MNEREAHDAVLSWCRNVASRPGKRIAEQPVMRDNPACVESYGGGPCFVFDLGRTELRPGSKWDYRERAVAMGETWRAVAAALQAQGVEL
jgi:hypothetical protein